MAKRISSLPSNACEFMTCCQRGHVRLPFLPPPPPFLCGVLESNDKQGNEFRTNIHRYNMALAFTSLGVKEDKKVNHQGGWVF